MLTVPYAACAKLQPWLFRLMVLLRELGRRYLVL